MIEAVGLNLVASVLFKGMELSTSKAHELYQREAFAEKVDEFTAAFTVALKGCATPELTEHTQLTAADVASGSGRSWSSST